MVMMVYQTNSLSIFASLLPEFAIENGEIFVDVSMKKGWLSIVMVVYQRVALPAGWPKAHDFMTVPLF